MSQYNTPNVAFPLVASYNERGITGFTSSITNSMDQLKINSFYEISKNSVTGKITPYLTKRPGCADSGNTVGLAGDTPYLNIKPPLQVADTGISWVFSVNGTDIKVSNASTSTTILASIGTYKPRYVDKTIISGTESIVFQCAADSASVHKTFYSTAIATWTEIVDAVYAALIHRGKIEHIDGFAFQMANDNYIYNSDINTLAIWGANSRIQKQILQDSPVGLARHGQLLLAFGKETVEGFRNQGNPTGSPLGRIIGLSQRYGLGTITAAYQRHYYATLGQRIYFVGRKTGSTFNLGLFSFDGERFEQVSTTFIDKILAGAPSYHICSLGFFGKSAIAISISTPINSTQQWLMFFPELNEWFLWTSTHIQPVNDGEYFIGIVGAASANKVCLFQNSGAAWVDGSSTAFTMTHQFKMPKNDNARQVMNWASVQADTATSASSLGVAFSDDDGVTWSTARDIDLTTEHKMITRCGSYKSRFVRLTHSANLECRLEKFLARVS